MQYFLFSLLIALTVLFVIEIKRSLRRSRITVELINKYSSDKKNPQLIEDIFNFIINDRRLSTIIQKHNANQSDIKALHDKLLIWGDFRKYNRYIPITSFFYAGALEYLLSHKNDDAKSLTQRMMNYFHI